MKEFVNRFFLLNLVLFVSVHSWSQDKTSDSVYIKSAKVQPVLVNDSFAVIAADPSLKGNAFLRFLIGRNYRKEWTEPIRVPVLHLNTTYGGLKPKKQGGGKETKSLQVEDSSGKVWALRSVEKFPENAIPPEFRNTAALVFVKDDISASYPYGALSMGVFSNAVQVPYLKDKLYFLPDDPALGKFRDKFKNTLVLMEEREPTGVPQSDESDENSKTLSTEKLVYKLAKNNDNKIDQLDLLKIRLLDNFVMDFDRHEGQWTWVQADSGKGKIFYAVPKDRDQVFYTNQGLLPRFARGKELFPELQGFRKKAKNIRNFNRAGRNFDRYCLSELTESDWSSAVDEFLNQMTDSVIEAALHQQPKEIQAYSAQKIIRTLKEKRKYFKDDMMKYYRFLSRVVSVVGSDERELFRVDRKEDGQVTVTVFALTKKGEVGTKMYERTFDPHITHEIRLYGLEGDDQFTVTGSSSKIKIRMIGGPGSDRFVNNGDAGRLIAYDVKPEQNSIEGHIRDKISWNPQNNDYTRLGYYYSTISPGLSLEYSSDGGIFIGPKLKITTQGFRAQPYATKQTFIINRSVSSSSYHLKYNGELLQLFDHTDLVANVDVRLPSNKTNFFGFGNNTVFDKSKPGKLEYYHTRYDFATARLYARTSFAPWLQLNYGPEFQFFRLLKEENATKFISQYPPYNDDASNYEGHYYLGAGANFIADTKNNKVFPTSGFEASGYIHYLHGISQFSTNNLTQVGGDFRVYIGPFRHKHFVLAGRIGGGYNFGNFDFEQAQYLGYKEDLRGYRLFRFAGRAKAFANVDFRWKVANINAFLFPASFGLLAFNDVGRVWSDGEISNVWHDGYGFGIWIAPVDRFLVTAAISRSREEPALALFTWGFKF